MRAIEAREGVTTGISAADRAKTIAVAIDSAKGAQDIATPGHVFPLRARTGGVLVRAGHTEAAVDVMRPPMDFPPAIRGSPGATRAAAATAERTVAARIRAGLGAFRPASM